MANHLSNFDITNPSHYLTPEGSIIMLLTSPCYRAVITTLSGVYIKPTLQGLLDYFSLYKNTKVHCSLLQTAIAQHIDAHKLMNIHFSNVDHYKTGRVLYSS